MIARFTIAFICFICSLCAQESEQDKHSKITDHKIVGYIDLNNKALYFQSKSKGSVLMFLPSSFLKLDNYLAVKGGELVFGLPVNQSMWLKSIPTDAPHAHRDRIDIGDYSEVAKIIEKNGFINAWADIILMDDDTHVVSGPYIMRHPITIKSIRTEDLDRSQFLIIPLK